MFRRTARAATEACVRLGISADVISYSSIVAAAAAAACFWRSSQHPWLLVIAPLLCFLRLWFNMLDGMVAVAGDKASLRGEIVNDLPDRVSDMLIFAGAAHSGWMYAPIGYWAAMLALFTAYVGLFGQAVGGNREFGGIMSKPWRMAVLAVGSWITFIMRPTESLPDRLSVLDWSCLIIIAGCVQTVLIRLKRIMITVQHRSR
ncbi:MAG: CDP-alcohol phosphatidyltransferase family protein [Chthoniobacterales bacterium]